ncbi:MAG: ribosome hibernation-promoting factor, HPF/YfiA family [Candidatus Borkfalkia sp.]
MRIEITAKSFTVGDKLKDLVEKKISKLDKYFESDAVCKVALKEEGKLSKMEVSIQYKGASCARKFRDNFYDDIDAVLPKIERQIINRRARFLPNSKRTPFSTSRSFSRTRPCPKANW